MVLLKTIFKIFWYGLISTLYSAASSLFLPPLGYLCQQFVHLLQFFGHLHLSCGIIAIACTGQVILDVKRHPRHGFSKF